MERKHLIFFLIMVCHFTEIYVTWIIRNASEAPHNSFSGLDSTGSFLFVSLSFPPSVKRLTFPFLCVNNLTEIPQLHSSQDIHLNPQSSLFPSFIIYCLWFCFEKWLNLFKGSCRCQLELMVQQAHLLLKP